MNLISRVLIITLLLPIQAFASSATGKYFDRSIIVIFENTNYADAIGQPFFKKLADNGALLTRFTALTHPSQGNYIGLTSGSQHGVISDSDVDISAPNVTDLLEQKGLTWKAYIEDFPGQCFTGTTSTGYARKHNPFISYTDIQKNPARCANIVDANQFDIDAKNGTLPDYVFYVPNLDNDGHDTDVGYADRWYSKKFSPYFADPAFMAGTIVISTFDESSSIFQNQVYTSIFGPSVKPVAVSTALNTYSLLNLIEDNWNLGDLGLNDKTATPVPNIWR